VKTPPSLMSCCGTMGFWQRCAREVIRWPRVSCPGEKVPHSSATPLPGLRTTYMCIVNRHTALPTGLSGARSRTARFSRRGTVRETEKCFLSGAVGRRVLCIVGLYGLSREFLPFAPFVSSVRQCNSLPCRILCQWRERVGLASSYPARGLQSTLGLARG
jgi:hypothetical protein